MDISKTNHDLILKEFADITPNVGFAEIATE
jgi:hypothetical protein